GWRRRVYTRGHVGYAHSRAVLAHRRDDSVLRRQAPAGVRAMPAPTNACSLEELDFFEVWFPGSFILKEQVFTHGHSGKVQCDGQEWK
ncbi:MAG TPA: hypothetical protein PKH07_06480, partial [bacterium]|nr:hypothetical protein [bacterium]